MGLALTMIDRVSNIGRFGCRYLLFKCKKEWYTISFISANAVSNRFSLLTKTKLVAPSFVPLSDPSYQPLKLLTCVTYQLDPLFKAIINYIWKIFLFSLIRISCWSHQIWIQYLYIWFCPSFCSRGFHSVFFCRSMRLNWME